MAYFAYCDDQEKVPEAEKFRIAEFLQVKRCILCFLQAVCFKQAAFKIILQLM